MKLLIGVGALVYVAVLVGGWLYLRHLRSPRPPEQRIKITDKRQAEFLDDERH